MKKYLIGALLLVLTVILVACGSNSTLRIEGSSNIELGFSEKYKVYLGNNIVSNDDLLWTISDRTVLLCNDSEIIPLKEGTCDVFAVLKSDGEKVAKITVKVTDARIKRIDIIGKDVVFIDDILNLDYIIDPIEEGNNIVWASSDESIASVDESGCVFGHKKGEVVITASCGKAVATKVLKVKEVITEITTEMPSEIVVGQAIEMKFNIDDPIANIKGDATNEFGILIGNKLYAKKEGVIRLSVKSKAQSQLVKVFEFNVAANKSNTVNYETENKRLIDEYLDIMSITQKIGQYAIASTAVNDLKEDGDGIFFNETRTGVIQKIYLSSLFDGREIGNFEFNYIMNSEPLNSLKYFPKLSKENSQIGGFNLMYDSNVDLLSYMAPRLNNRGVGKLSPEEFYKYQTIFAKELKELGINTYIVSGFDGVNDDTFSNDIVKNNYYLNLMMDAFKEQGIMLAFAMNTYYPTKEALIQLVNNDVDMITIPKNTENYDGEKSLVEYLRNELKYNGLIYFDYDIYDYYYYEEALTSLYNDLFKAIKDGIDFYYAPIYINSNRNSWDPNFNDYVFFIYDKLLENLLKKENEQTILASTKRILEKKIKFECINGTYPVDEISDYSSDKNFINSLYKKTYDIFGTNYTPLTKQANSTFIYSETYRTGDWRTGRKTFNFATSMGDNLNKSGYKNVTTTNTFNKNYQSVFDSFVPEDQIILYIRSAECSFSYKETVNDNGNEGTITRYGSFLWSDVVKKLYDRGVTNITIVIENDSALANDYAYLTNVINLGGNLQTNYSAAIDLIVDGK